MLLGKQLTPISQLDEDYRDISILTDGLLGLPSNYHCGQMISSATPALQIAVPRLPGMRKVRVWTTKNTSCHVAFPKKVMLIGSEEIAVEAVPEPTAYNPARAVVELSVPSTGDGDLIIKIVRDPEERTMAIDEIEAYK